MRFINTHSQRFETATVSEDGKKYAILSHRWGTAAEEVSFADINESRNFSHKQEYAKLKGFCDLAASLGYDYGWVDTCCISKSDLTELTEAVTSMYRWYQGSGLCIVYLADVPRLGMFESVWWSRGWTLQELVGPKSASFYDCDWHLLGTKAELLSEISTKTAIHEDVLSHNASPAICSVAQRMSWAARRETTRVEDRAYSLLGIFGVHMSTIYGERENAFLRLQEAIIQKGKDESIFAWDMGIGKDKKSYSGLLAPSPSSFVDCGDVIGTRGSTGFDVKNGELRISLKTFPYCIETYYALLNCTQRNRPDGRISILISTLSTENEYVRVKKVHVGGKVLLAGSSLGGFRTRDICVSLDPVEHPLNQACGFWLRAIEPPGHSGCQVKILSRSITSEADKVCIDDNYWGTAGIVSVEPKVKMGRSNAGDQMGWSRIRWIKLGFDEDFTPMLLLANGHGSRWHSDQPFWVNEELFEQANASEDGSKARKEIFNDGWIISQAAAPSREYSRPGGILVLKVDRKEGISEHLGALNLRITVRLAPERSPHIMYNKNTDACERHIWVVEITDTRGTVLPISDSQG